MGKGKTARVEKKRNNESKKCDGRLKRRVDRVKKNVESEIKRTCDHMDVK